jgi:hypothetical protein
MCKNFTGIHYNIAQGTVIYQYSLHLYQQPSFTFEGKHVFPSGKNCSPFSAATGPWYSKVTHHLHNDCLTGILSKDQRGANMMVQDQNSQVDVATVSI